MNINELFRRLNRAIAVCKEEMNREADMGKRIHLQGMAQGFEICMKTINEINFDPPGPVNPLRCLGWGSRRGNCGLDVPKKFLQLYCDVCSNERLLEAKNSGRTLYKMFDKANDQEDEISIIPFPEANNE